MEDIKEHIDPNQFGSLKGVSTTFCLLDMLHNWLSVLESPGTYPRVCFLDFSEAFDHIDHNILVCKLLKMGARSIVVKWICSFPPQRRQAVKLDGLLSEWATIQNDLDSITAWAEENCICLNPKKCTKCLVLLFVTT